MSSNISFASSFETSFQEKILRKSFPNELQVSLDEDNIEALIDKLDNFSNNLKVTKSINSKNSTFFSNLVKAINLKLPKLSADIFDKIAFKLYNKLTDIFKDFSNQLKTNDNYKNEIFRFNFVNLNICLGQFLRVFTRNFQNYNEIHKNVIKNLPNFLKIFFKVFEENLALILYQVTSNIKNFDLIKSYITMISLIIHNQTNMLRPFEVKLENILNNILINIISCDDLNKIDSCFIDLLTGLYGYLINLSNDINKKFPTLLQKYIDSLNHYLKLIQPISIKNKKNLVNGSNKKEKVDKNASIDTSLSKKPNNNSKENDFVFLFDEISDEIIKDIIKIRNVIFILFKLIKNLILTISNYSVLDLNLRFLISFALKNLFYEFSRIPNNEYIISGLPVADYNLIVSYLRFSGLKLMKKFVVIFSPYLNFYIPLFKDIVKRLTLYKNETSTSGYLNNFENFFEMKNGILKFIKTLIAAFDLKVFQCIREYILKFSINEFSDILICYLEKNDKTVVKMDKGYFKLSNISTVNGKNNKKNFGNNNNKLGNVSLLDIAKQETYNSKLDIYSNKELEILIVSYLKIFTQFLKSESFLIISEDEKLQLKAIIDLICFPSYAKFIFNLSENMKSKIITLIYAYINILIKSKKNESDEVIVEDRLLYLLKNFYHSEKKQDDLISTFNLIHNEKNLKIIATNEKTINLSEGFLDLNKKLRDKFSQIYNDRLEKLNEIIMNNSLLQSEKISNVDNSTASIAFVNSGESKLLGNKTLRDNSQDINNKNFNHITTNILDDNKASIPSVDAANSVILESNLSLNETYLQDNKKSNNMPLLFNKFEKQSKNSDNEANYLMNSQTKANFDNKNSNNILNNEKVNKIEDKEKNFSVTFTQKSENSGDEVIIPKNSMKEIVNLNNNDSDDDIEIPEII